MAAALTYAVCVNFADWYPRPADMGGDSSISLTDAAGTPGSSASEGEEHQVHLREAQMMDGAQVLEVGKKEAKRASMQSARQSHV
jgi:hypothetical protein